MPAIPFPGGKARLAKQIVSLLPRHGRTYVEPFCGRGNLYWAAVSHGLQYRQWWLNDLSTIPFFRAIQSVGNNIKVPTRCRTEFERQKEAYRSGDLTAILLEPFLTFNGGGYFSAGCKGKEHVTENDHGGGVSGAGYERAIRDCHRIMQQTRPRLTSFDWREMGIDRLREDDVVVIDAPYANADVGCYSPNTVNHEELVDTLLRARFKWILCGYLHPVLHRLGEPVWAKDVQSICFPPDERDSRTECLWANFVSRSNRHAFPPSLRSRLRTLVDASSLSFPDLDAKIEDGLETVAKDWNTVVPYLLEMHRRLSAPGRRADLRKGAPVGLTWTQWVESKRSQLGRSLRSVQRLLRGKTEASRNWKAGGRGTTRWREVDGLPNTAMGLAFEMATLIIKMRNRTQRSVSNRRRLEQLASRFLAVAGRCSAPGNGLPPADRAGIANPKSTLASLTM